MEQLTDVKWKLSKSLISGTEYLGVAGNDKFGNTGVIIIKATGNYWQKL